MKPAYDFVFHRAASSSATAPKLRNRSRSDTWPGRQTGGTGLKNMAQATAQDLCHQDLVGARTILAGLTPYRSRKGRTTGWGSTCRSQRSSCAFCPQSANGCFGEGEWHELGTLLRRSLALNGRSGPFLRQKHGPMTLHRQRKAPTLQEPSQTASEFAGAVQSVTKRRILYTSDWTCKENRFSFT